MTGQRIEDEKNRLNDLINSGTYRAEYNRLHAARQALCWAINPESAASPVISIMGSQEELTGCQDGRHPPQF